MATLVEIGLACHFTLHITYRFTCIITIPTSNYVIGMSVKFWLIVTVISVALAHTYVYTDLLQHSKPDVLDRTDLSRYMTAMWFSMADAWQQLRSELKLHLEVGHQAALTVRRNIAEYRKRREQLRAERKAKWS